MVVQRRRRVLASILLTSLVLSSGGASSQEISYKTLIRQCLSSFSVAHDRDDLSVHAPCHYDVLGKYSVLDSQKWEIINYFWNHHSAAASRPFYLPWATDLAREGDAEALYAVANAQDDPERRIALLGLAARQGSLAAEEYLYKYMLNNPSVVDQGKARAEALLAAAAESGHDWAVWKMRSRDRQQAQASSGERATLAAVLGLVVVAAALSDAGGGQSSQVEAAKACSGASDMFAWSGGDLHVAAALSLGGCSPF